MKRFTKYRCQFCKSEFITDRHQRWTMNSCECGKTRIDDSEGCSRNLGAIPEVIASADTLECLEPQKKKKKATTKKKKS